MRSTSGIQRRTDALVASLISLAGLVAAGTLPACGAPRAEDPQSVLHRYARALDEGRPDDAYRLLSDEARRGMPLDAFRRMVKENPEEVRELAKALGRPTSLPLVTARVAGASGQELVLVLENGAWKIDASSIDLYAQDTPRHAVLGFLRAVERKRYDVVLKYVPDAHRDGLDEKKLKEAWEGHDKEAMQRVVTAVRQALPTATIEETGDRAAFTHAAGTMQLVREHGLWKIEDFD